jgi:hypothetical protein
MGTDDGRRDFQATKLFLPQRYPWPAASLLSRVFFLWAYPWLRMARLRPLGEADLPACDPALVPESVDDRMAVQWQAELERARRTGARPSLLRCFAHIMGTDLVVMLLQDMVWGGTIVAMPLLVREAVAFVAGHGPYEGGERPAVWYGYALSVLVLAVGLTGQLCHQNVVYWQFHYAAMCRGALLSMMYRKSMVLSHQERQVGRSETTTLLLCMA